MYRWPLSVAVAKNAQVVDTTWKAKRVPPEMRVAYLARKKEQGTEGVKPIRERAFDMPPFVLLAALPAAAWQCGGSLHLPARLHHLRSASPPKLGLIDWMLDAPHIDPMAKLTRAEGWEATLKLNGAAARPTVGVRFYVDPDDTEGPNAPRGCMELKSPSQIFSEEGGQWETVEHAAGSSTTPSLVRFRLRTQNGIYASTKELVAPDVDLYFTTKLYLEQEQFFEDGNFLRDGVLSTAADATRLDEVVGRCEFFPLSLMGSN